MQYKPMLLFQFAPGANDGLQINSEDLLKLMSRRRTPGLDESTNHAGMEPRKCEYPG